MEFLGTFITLYSALAVNCVFASPTYVPWSTIRIICIYLFKKHVVYFLLVL